MSIAINVRVNPYYRGVKALDGNTYTFRFHWNNTLEKWYMDILGISNDVAVCGIALTCGKDLLASHGYYELGELWVVDNDGANADPNYDDIGSRWTLEYTPAA
ncbi:phage baseplate plug family protein [Candidatus Magnetobacterium casense]|uniref:Cyanophage baseplate Pam3 plug gp18 domain-containing protein n=1 Tax=Candidatus Magnetobacterium casense TaxID=1455061 RepID=A0ABS6RWG9_9BACT|nr:hypothetical protein [Candidatus Magnetobacterium casensis]MBV6340984.1 hypothetical protein [Candidatus Magnetobacterium casensis]